MNEEIRTKDQDEVVGVRPVEMRPEDEGRIEDPDLADSIASAVNQFETRIIDYAKSAMEAAESGDSAQAEKFLMHIKNTQDRVEKLTELIIETARKVKVAKSRTSGTPQV